jgi:hypothetical protein
MKIIFTSFIIILLFSNCVVHNNQKAMMNSIPLGTSPIRSDFSTDKIHLFFDNEKIDFPYVRIKQIEVEGGRRMPNNIILDYLKDEVYKSQGNAIINIVSENKSYINYDNPNDSYTTKVYRGIIVYSESLKTNWLEGKESPYAKNIENHFESVKGSNGGLFFLSTIVSTIYLILELKTI